VTFDEIVDAAYGDGWHTDEMARAEVRSVMASCATLVCRCCSEGSRPVLDTVVRNYRHADIHDYECDAAGIWKVLAEGEAKA